MKLLLILCIAVLGALAYRAIAHQSLRTLLYRKLRPLRCNYIGHERSRRSILKDGERYRSHCRRCGTQMEKIGKEGEWRSLADHG